jgi:hypothetical protein
VLVPGLLPRLGPHPRDPPGSWPSRPFCTYRRVHWRLVELREQFSRSLLTAEGGLVDIDLQQSVRGLGGAASLLGAYANLGLRSAVGSDDVLSGLVNGTDPLYGGEARLVAEITAAITDRQTQRAPLETGGAKLDAQVAELAPRLAAAIDDPAEPVNALLSSVQDSLALTQLAAARALPVAIASPAEGAKLASAHPEFGGTNTKDPDLGQVGGRRRSRARRSSFWRRRRRGAWR